MTLDQYLPTMANFAPQETPGNVWDIFGYYIWAWVCYWRLGVEAWDAAKHFAMYKTEPLPRNK